MYSIGVQIFLSDPSELMGMNRSSVSMQSVFYIATAFTPSPRKCGNWRTGSARSNLGLIQHRVKGAADFECRWWHGLVASMGKCHGQAPEPSSPQHGMEELIRQVEPPRWLILTVTAVQRVSTVLVEVLHFPGRQLTLFPGHRSQGFSANVLM